MTYLAKVHAIPCCVCFYRGEPQGTPTVAHHLEWIRDDLSDYASVSLCDYHHKELHSLSRRGFEMRYSLTAIDLLALTNKLLHEGAR